MSGTMLLPTHHRSEDRQQTAKLSNVASDGRIRLGDVWDERENIFDIGDSDSDDDGERTNKTSTSERVGVSEYDHPRGPSIIVTSS